MKETPENEYHGYVPHIELDSIQDTPPDPEDSSQPSDNPPEEAAALEAMLSAVPPESYFDAPNDTPTKTDFRERIKKNRLFYILSSIFLVLALGCVGVISYVYFVINPYGDYDRILPNVYCAGINLGGMTTQEAQNAVEDALRNPSYTVTLVLPDCTYQFCPQQEGITLNGAAIAQQAYNYMRTDLSAYGMYKAYHAAKRTEHHLNADITLDFSLEDIENQAQRIYEETFVDATASTIYNTPEAHTVSVALGTPGHQVNRDDLIALVTEAFTAMSFEDIIMEYEPVEINLVAVWEMCKQAVKDYSYAPVDPAYYANEEAHTIELTMGTPGYQFTANELYTLVKSSVERREYGTVTLDMTEVSPADVDITPSYYALACDPVEPYYAYGDVQEGSNGYSLDWEAAIASILDASWGQSLTIPMLETKPTRTAEDIRSVLFRDELGSYSSPHTAESGRTTNLKLACKAIDGTVINPGEVFSFNNVVGQRTAAKGYQEAIAYVGSQSVRELGGGICQVASTIYDAALYADLQIVERECHMYFVTYVKGGLDATVYWGSVDFQFRNNTEYPIRINASVSGGYVHISIDGTKTNDNYVVLSSSCLSSTPYGTVTKYDSSKPAGYSSETTSPYTGYVYEAYQYVYSGDGTLLETNYLGKSTYKKRDRVITVGTG